MVNNKKGMEYIDMVDANKLLKEILKNVELSIYNDETDKRIVTIYYPCSCVSISKYFIDGEVKEQITIKNKELGLIANIDIEEIKRYEYICNEGYEEEFIVYV